MALQQEPEAVLTEAVLTELALIRLARLLRIDFALAPRLELIGAKLGEPAKQVFQRPWSRRCQTGWDSASEICHHFWWQAKLLAN